MFTKSTIIRFTLISNNSTIFSYNSILSVYIKLNYNRSWNVPTKKRKTLKEALSTGWFVFDNFYGYFILLIMTLKKEHFVLVFRDKFNSLNSFLLLFLRHTAYFIFLFFTQYKKLKLMLL